jgi:hypothetical protein
MITQPAAVEHVMDLTYSVVALADVICHALAALDAGDADAARWMLETNRDGLSAHFRCH